MKRISELTKKQKQELEETLNDEHGYGYDGGYQTYRVIGDKVYLIDDGEMFATTFDCGVVHPRLLAKEFNEFINIPEVDPRDIIFIAQARFDKWFLSKEFVNELNKIDHMIYTYEPNSEYYKGKIDFMDSPNWDKEVYLTPTALMKKIDAACPGKIVLEDVKNIEKLGIEL